MKLPRVTPLFFLLLAAGLVVSLPALAQAPDQPETESAAAPVEAEEEMTRNLDTVVRAIQENGA